MTAHPLVVRVVAASGLAATIVLLLDIGVFFGAPRGVPPWQLPLDDPVVATVELVRIPTLVGASWLLLVTVLDTAARWLRIAPLIRLVRRMAPAFWRHAVLRPVATLAVLAPPVVAPTMAAAPAVAIVMPAESPTAPGTTDAPEPTPVLRMTAGVAPAETRPVAAEVPTLTMSVHRVAPPSDEIPPESRSDTYVVQGGDNLWSIAASHLAAETGTHPSGSEVTPYWRALIDANRDALPDPANPDLLFPGIVLRLPPVG